MTEDIELDQQSYNGDMLSNVATPINNNLECKITSKKVINLADYTTNQQQPLNLKATEFEESDKDSRSSSPEIASKTSIEVNCPNNLFEQTQRQLLVLNAALQSRQMAQTIGTDDISRSSTPEKIHREGIKNVNNNMVPFSIRSSPHDTSKPHKTSSSNPSSPRASSRVNSPLNLSLSASSSVKPSKRTVNGQFTDKVTSTNTKTNGKYQSSRSTTPMTPSTPSEDMSNNNNNYNPVIPQLILASGQMIEGIQGAQLLIPTSQGVQTQNILTIPIDHVNGKSQIVNLALSNGQSMSTTVSNLQAMTQPTIPPFFQNSSLDKLYPFNDFLTTSLPTDYTRAQQLAPRIQQLLTALHQQQQPTYNPPNVHQPSPPPATSPPVISPHSQTNHNSHDTPQNLSHKPSKSYQPSYHADNLIANTDRDIPRGINLTNGLTSNSPPSPSGHSEALTAAALNSISRLAANNCELTITTAPHANVTGSSSGAGSLAPLSIKLSPNSMKMSPNSMKHSPTGSENSSNDLLIDSPGQPTINQTTSNMVDGINLEEIKEFAKAFKLRRLSLGLTQTQVGQALSVTEGPAYSQSAICSALATQMYCAAQLSSQQQASNNMFEKLDITPKSAQKIKPVLERWMKEAEERYKNGQNHLTDFIGVEPSKKRKRRTSFTPQALELLNAHFERNTHPSGTEITGLAHQLGYEREVIRIWFCNKRQALKNTVRMMSKGMV